MPSLISGSGSGTAFGSVIPRRWAGEPGAAGAGAACSGRSRRRADQNARLVRSSRYAVSALIESGVNGVPNMISSPVICGALVGDRSPLLRTPLAGSDTASGILSRTSWYGLGTPQ